MEGTFWALVPTLAAVVAALITKEVILSLFAGIFVGAMLISGGDLAGAIYELFMIMGSKTGADFAVQGDRTIVVGLGNAGIIIFIIELGLLVVLMDRSGATEAFGAKVSTCVRSQRSALLAASGLGCLIFADDYFNRLAVGTVMRPVADRYGISREKLAYIIGSVSVSICILVPISSWAGAVTGNIAEGLTDGNAFDIYLATLSCNFYPILTLILLFVSPLFKVDLFATNGGYKPPEVSVSEPKAQKGRPMYLILPVLTLIVLNVIMMTSTSLGSEMSLVISGAAAVFVSLVLCLCAKTIRLKEVGLCLLEGIKSVGDVLIILVFAWTLTGVCDKLGVGEFIEGLTNKMGGLRTLLPAIMFVLAMGTSFATGTAWGTFGMLVPLAVPMFGTGTTLQILTISAVLSGSVFGNQVSPISDSTMLASKVCECDHMVYIKAQLKAAMPIAVCALSGFLVSGLTSSVPLGWAISGFMFAVLLIIVGRRKRVRTRKAIKALHNKRRQA